MTPKINNNQPGKMGRMRPLNPKKIKKTAKTGFFLRNWRISSANLLFLLISTRMIIALTIARNSSPLPARFLATQESFPFY